MHVTKVLIAAGMMVYQSGLMLACEKYNSYSNEEAKEYLEMLNNPDANPVDRMFAIQQLACSDNPNLRNHSVKEGLKQSADPLVRNQVMLVAMMQKQRIDVELSSQKELTKGDKKFIADNSGTYSNNVKYRSESEGCISLYSPKECLKQNSLFIKGDKLEFNHGAIMGEFRLSEGNELVGYIRVKNTSQYSRIPAVIKLF